MNRTLKIFSQELQKKKKITWEYTGMFSNTCTNNWQHTVINLVIKKNPKTSACNFWKSGLENDLYYTCLPLCHRFIYNAHDKKN